jgi:hypothetical protein
MKMHPSLTEERIMRAIENPLSLDDTGFCIACGASVYGVEPDARRYTCEACGEKAVYGAEELAMRLVGHYS